MVEHGPGYVTSVLRLIAQPISAYSCVLVVEHCIAGKGADAVTLPDLLSGWRMFGLSGPREG